MSSPEHKQKVWEIISEIGTGMLVTEEKGAIRARPMQIVQKEYDGTLWFFTRVDVGKVDEPLEEENVCVTFSHPDQKTFVSLSGRAKLTWDRNLVDKFWSPTVSAWFPEGKDSFLCALLEIDIKHGESWDSDVSTLGFAYEMAKAKINKQVPELGENKKF